VYNSLQKKCHGSVPEIIFGLLSKILSQIAADQNWIHFCSYNSWREYWRRKVRDGGGWMIVAGLKKNFKN